MEICVGSLFCFVVLGALSSLASSLLRNRELDALLLLSCGCRHLYSVALHSLPQGAMGWSAVWKCNVTFIGHTHLLFSIP